MRSFNPARLMGVSSSCVALISVEVKADEFNTSESAAIFQGMAYHHWLTTHFPWMQETPVAFLALLASKANTKAGENRSVKYAVGLPPEGS
mmetsp:Transcript_49351/g.159526  ORF Transcript_49351/g.159526 Transcript_49351/m.159526 type:complete len:91 (+) Transcript_49351:753-1025(+)